MNEEEIEHIRWEAQAEMYNRIYNAMFIGDTSDPLVVAKRVFNEIKEIRNELALYEQQIGKRN